MTGLSTPMRPVIFGEVLYDMFPDGTEVLGGAPFNVAWHLQGLGLAPLFVSRVGHDRLGDRILRAMDEWGMDTSAVFQDPDHPTGQVRVSLENGQPDFDIVSDVAYDHVMPGMVKNLYDHPAYGPLYHGSLIGRTPDSAKTLSLLRQSAPAIFMDINLRAPWWNKMQLDELLQGINWIKLNDDELTTLSGCQSNNSQLIEETTRGMLESYSWEAAIVTRGSEGAMLVKSEETRHIPPVEVGRLVDTVGAGDGFSAVWLAGLLRDWPDEVKLQRAVEFASVICSLRGAINQDEEFYRYYRYLWTL
ncbi:carbohydrate kinase family protein [Thiohalophilus sp.]|uniref:carbohydrate kinase family protein n=1 Tax=Thiohalophilus sp. TaxID=3028392 RepID=UPI003975A3CF